jgi:hypothetical protein
MDAARQIKARMERIFQDLAEPVLWDDRRLHSGERRLHGYLTKGSGKDAGQEFRFPERVDGLASGAILRLASADERWRVAEVHIEELDQQVLFVAAKVVDLSAPEPEALPEELDGILLALGQALDASTLGPLEREDVREALLRLPALAQSPGDPGHATRLKQRLSLLKDRFKACPQVQHQAKGLLLKLEVQLKRKGLP